MNLQHIYDALDNIAVPNRTYIVHHDLMHTEINQQLLGIGHDTIDRDDLHQLLADLDYRIVLDEFGRLVVKGLGLRSNRGDDEWSCNHLSTHTQKASR